MLKKVTFANPARVSPDVAYHAIRISNQIALSKFALLKKTKRPRAMAKEVKQLSR